MLSMDQVREFRANGYCVYRSFLSDTELRKLIPEIETICAGATVAYHNHERLEMEPQQKPDGRMVRRIYEPCTYYQPFKELSESKNVLDIVEQLIGPNLTFHYSKINMKPPSIGSVVEWHQDLAYYPLTNTDSLAVLFYLDAADSSNGCLQVIPGYHCGSVLDHTQNGYFQGQITQTFDKAKTAVLDGPAGTAIFMHGLTPHASAPNTSDLPRRTLILSYRAADAFPIYIGEMTAQNEGHVRHVRGERSRLARFSMNAFPIPRYLKKTRSLYELQELSRQSQSPT